MEYLLAGLALTPSLHFVRCSDRLLQCGSAAFVVLLPPSLGVSSLDLGRLQPRAALFSCSLICSLDSFCHSAAARYGRISSSGISAMRSASVIRLAASSAKFSERS